MIDNSIATPANELQQRIQNLQTQMAAAGVDAALILQNSDLFYFAGTIQQAHLYVPIDDEPLLMARKDYERARSESGLNRVVPLTSIKLLPQIIKDHGYQESQTLGMELDVLPVNLFHNYSRIFDGVRIADISHPIRLVRAVKSAWEIDRISHAAELSDQVAASMHEFLTEGMTEIELAGLVEARARKLGHQGVVRMRLWGSEMFYGHLMAGPSAAVPSFLASPTGGAAVSPAVAQGSSFNAIQRNEPVLLDYVFAYRGYLSDHTRIFSLGRLPDELVRAHEAMLKIQEAIKIQVRPGMPAGEVYDIAVSMAAEQGYADHFMGVGDQRIRFVGHGVGTELDEYPFLARGQQLELQQGMVIALEPKLIFPGKGVVGIENTHVVTDNGLKQLGKFNEGINVVGPH